MAKTQLPSATGREQVAIKVGDIIRPWWARGNWTLYKVVEIYEDPTSPRHMGPIIVEAVVIVRNNGTKVKRGTRRFKFSPVQLQRVTEDIIQREVAAKQQELTYRVDAVLDVARGVI